MADVGGFMRNDQVVLGIGRRLDVIAVHTGAFAAGGLGAYIRMGKRGLPIRWLLFHLLDYLHLLAEFLDFVLEAGDFGFGDIGLRPVGGSIAAR